MKKWDNPPIRYRILDLLMEENFVSFSRVLRLLDISFYDFEGELGASYLEVRMGLELDNSNRVRTCGLKNV